MIADRFRVERVLGQGGCGKVYLARDGSGGQLVALKVLNEQAKKVPQATKRFCREARAQAKLVHPSVARILAHDLDAESPWLALEFVEGRDLEKAIKDEGRLPAPMVVRLGVEVAGALGELHRHGILHRDLKPSNLMIRAADGQAVVMDLGLAALQDATVITETGQLFGTPAYLPPEVVRGEAWTTSGDVYQLGAILFECLTGQMLIPGRRIEEVLRAAARGERRPFPPEVPIPDDLRDVIWRATDPDARQRFASAQEMEAALAAVDLGRVGASPGPGPAGLSYLDDGIIQPGATAARSGRWLATLTGASRPGKAHLGLGLLFLSGLGLGFLGTLGGPPAPSQVQVEVLGDALVVSFRDQGQAGAQLRLGDELVSPPLEVRQGRRRLVHRGLPEDRPTEVRLVLGSWEGEAQAVQGSPPAISGVVGLAPAGSLEVEVARPCVARWADGGTTRFELARGRQALALPGPLTENLALEWEERGLPFAARWTLDEVFTRSLERLRERLGATSWHGPLLQRASSRDRRGEGFGEERRSFEVLLPWIPRIFSSGLPPAEKRWLFETLQDWQRSVAAERLLGDEPEDLPLPPGEAGYHGPRPPPWSPEGEAVLDLKPLDGAAPTHEAGLIFMIPPYGRNSPPYGAKAYDYASRVGFAWPPGVPAQGTGCLTLDMDRLMGPLLQRTAPAGPGGLVLEHWSPSPEKLRLQERYKGLVTTCFPLELAPGAGTPMEISVAPLLAPIPQFQTLAPGGHVLRWRRGE